MLDGMIKGVILLRDGKFGAMLIKNGKALVMVPGEEEPRRLLLQDLKGAEGGAFIENGAKSVAQSDDDDTIALAMLWITKGGFELLLP